MLVSLFMNNCETIDMSTLKEKLIPKMIKHLIRNYEMYLVFDKQSINGIERYTIVSSMILERLAFVGETRSSIIHMVATKDCYDSIKYMSMMMHQIFKSLTLKMHKVFFIKRCGFLIDQVCTDLIQEMMENMSFESFLVTK
jgi:hypothetical protein